MTEKQLISIELSREVLTLIDQIKGELGLRSRGALIERLLEELLLAQDNDNKE